MDDARSIYRSPEHEARVVAHYERWLASFAFPLESVFVETTAGRTHLLATGPEDAPALVFVHGINTHALFMVESYAEALRERYRCFFVDVPGNPGRSGGPLPHFNDGSFGRWMREVVDAIGVDRFGIVGVSMGSLIALWACAELGPRVTRAAFLVPAGFVDVRLSWPMLRLVVRQLILQRWPSPASARRSLAGSMRPGAVIEDRVVEVIELLFASLRPPEAGNEATIPKPLSPEALAEFRGPSLVLAGATDAIFPGRKVVAAAPALLDNPKTILLEDGHIGAGDSDETRAHVLRFLADTDAASARA